MTRRNIRTINPTFDQEFNKISKQVNSTFRWAKVFWVIGVGLSAATACGVIYLLYAASQWLLNQS